MFSLVYIHSRYVQYLDEYILLRVVGTPADVRRHAVFGTASCAYDVFDVLPLGQQHAGQIEAILVPLSLPALLTSINPNRLISLTLNHYCWQPTSTLSLRPFLRTHVNCAHKPSLLRRYSFAPSLDYCRPSSSSSYNTSLSLP